MTLTPMQTNMIYDIIDSCYLNNKYYVQIVLIDGKTVAGSICTKVTMFDSKGSYTPPSRERCFSDSTLVIYYGKIFNEHSIYIPLDIIAGISNIGFEEEKIELVLEPRYSSAVNYSVEDYMFQDMLLYASINNLRIERHFPLYSLLLSKPFAWGDLSYQADVALYADWKYLETISGGVNSLGAGFGMISLSAGWTNSLWAQFKKKVSQNSIDIGGIITESEVVVRGYVTFIECYQNSRRKKQTENTIDIEGATWLSAVISAKRINTISDLVDNQWALIYLRDDGLMFPKEAWERISNPVNVFCEVVHSVVHSELGTTRFYLKARCAAYIHTN